MAETKAAGAERITVKEVRFAIRACSDAKKRQDELTAADEIKKAAMMGVFERLLGVKTSTELAMLSPDDIRKLAKARVKKGEVELEGFELEELLNVIQQSAKRRNVSWKEEFTRILGESKANEVMNGTQETYSYKFVDVPLGMGEAHAAAVGASSVPGPERAEVGKQVNRGVVARHVETAKRRKERLEVGQSVGD